MPLKFLVQYCCFTSIWLFNIFKATVFVILFQYFLNKCFGERLSDRTNRRKKLICRGRLPDMTYLTCCRRLRHVSRHCCWRAEERQPPLSRHWRTWGYSFQFQLKMLNVDEKDVGAYPSLLEISAPFLHCKSTFVFQFGFLKGKCNIYKIQDRQRPKTAKSISRM